MRTNVLLLSCCIAQAACSAAFAQCEPQWSDQFRSPMLNGAWCFVEYDPDGFGGLHPQLIAAGLFRQVEGNSKQGEPLGGIAKWDGGGWLPLGKGLLSDVYASGYYTGSVLAVDVFDEDGDGPHAPRLFAGGDISPPGLIGEAIVCWDGERWEGRSGNELAGIVKRMVIVGRNGTKPTLFVAGAFDAPAPSGLMRYDAGHWLPIAGFAPDSVTAMSALDIDGPGPLPERLCIAAIMDMGAPNERLEINHLDGDARVFVAPAPPGTVMHQINCLAQFDEDGAGPFEPALFAGGRMANHDDFPIAGISKWNGGAWEPVGRPGEIEGVGMAMRVFDDDGDGPHPTSLFVAGLGAGPPGEILGVSTWDGQNWGVCAKGAGFIDTNSVLGTIPSARLDECEPESLIMPGSASNGVGSVIRWDGGQWVPLLGSGVTNVNPWGTGTSTTIAECFAVDDSSSGDPGRCDLIVGGMFMAAGNVVAPNIARWTGREWREMGSLFDVYVDEMTKHDVDGTGPAPNLLYATGYSNSHPAGFQVAAWTGVDWEVIGSETSANPGEVTAMTSFDSDGTGPIAPILLLAGDIPEINGHQIGSPAQWDGKTWTTFGGVITNSRLLAVFDEDGPGVEPARLFGTAIIVPGGSHELARWNGVEWTRVGPTPHRSISAMTVADCDGDGPESANLLISCTIRLEGETQPKHRIAKWNGKFWTYLPPFGATPSRVDSIAVMDDDGNGPEPTKIYVSGSLSISNSQPYQNALVWNGASWSVLGGGMKAMYHYSSSLVYDDDGPGGNPPNVVFGGSIVSVGSLSSSGLARWGRLAPTIMIHPKNRTVDPLAAVTFSVRVGAGNANTFQWRKNGRPLRDDAHVTGVHTDTLRITSAKDFDEGSYDVVVTNDCGTSESLQAQLTVRGGRPIGSRPVQ